MRVVPQRSRTPGAHAGRAAVGLLLAALLALTGVSRTGLADELPATLCMTFADGAWPSAGALEPLLRIEARKAGLALTLSSEVSRSLCGTAPGCSALLEVGASALKLTLGGVSLRPLPASELDPEDGADDVARRVVGTLAACARGLDMTPGDGAACWPRGVAGAGGVAGIPLEPRFVLQVGGIHEFQVGPAMSLGGFDVTLGAALFGQRMLIGARVGWLPPQSVPGAAIPARVQTLPAALVFGGGDWLGPVYVGAAGALAMEWRRLDVDAPVAADVRRQDFTVFGVGAELDVGFVLEDPWNLGFSFGVRGYPTGRDFTSSAGDLYVSPRWTVTTAMRIGVAVPGAAD